MGFEPTRGDPIGLAGRRLSRSAKVSSAKQTSNQQSLADVETEEPSPPRFGPVGCISWPASPCKSIAAPSTSESRAVDAQIWSCSWPRRTSDAGDCKPKACNRRRRALCQLWGSNPCGVASSGS